MTISEKVAYLKGLADGLDLTKEPSKEAKILSVVIEVLEEIGLFLEDLEDSVDTLGEGLDAVSDDLEDVEMLLFEDDDEDDETACCCCCGDDADCDEDFFEVTCPNCDEELAIDESVLDAGQITCPKCGESFSLELVDDDEDGEE